MIEKNSDGLYETCVNGRTFQFQKWGTTQSALTLLDLLRISHLGVGEAVGILFASDIDTEVVTSSMVSKAMAQLLDGLSREPQKTISILQRLVAQGVLLDGRRVNFEEDFKDDFELMLSACAAAFEVQYKNFSFVSTLTRRWQALMKMPAPAASET